ncbi:Cadherin-like beta sandwich domain-containing protein, partial [Natronincola peptidivorans]
SGQASEAIALKVGANTITVEVTAEDGVTIKTYTITINRAAPSSGGGGGYTPPISPPQPAPIPDVTGGVSTDTVTLGTEVLEKQATITDSGGMVEIFTLQTIAAQQQLVAARLEGKTTMEIKIESNPMTTTIINIPEDFLKSSVDMKVTVATQQATLELPATLVAILAEAGEGLSLRMERGDAEIVQKGLDETRYGEGSAILGNPTMVNTTLKGETTVILPLEGIAFPEDAQQREDFLDSLAVFVIHSDGEKKVIGGEIIFDADGNPVSIKFSVDRFSTFAIIKQSEALKQRNIISLTIGDRTAIINGRSYKLDAAPLIDPKTNRTLVPLRFVSEMLGAKVEWLKESRQVRITQQETEIILTIGSHTAVVNNNIIALDCPAEILPPGRTFVPLRFVSQALGANIEWDESTQTITISQ